MIFRGAAFTFRVLVEQKVGVTPHPSSTDQSVADAIQIVWRHASFQKLHNTLGNFRRRCEGKSQLDSLNEPLWPWLSWERLKPNECVPHVSSVPTLSNQMPFGVALYDETY